MIRAPVLLWAVRAILVVMVSLGPAAWAIAQDGVDAQGAFDHYLDGRGALADGKYRDAATSFEAAIREDPGPERYHYEFGKVVLEKVLDPDRAIRVLADVDSVAAEFWLGFAYQKRELPDQAMARESFRKVQSYLASTDRKAHPVFAEINSDRINALIGSIAPPKYAVWKWLFSVLFALGLTTAFHRLVFANILAAPGERKPTTIILVLAGNVVLAAILLGIVASSLGLTTRQEILTVGNEIIELVKNAWAAVRSSKPG